jgi:hypothetical protein
MRGDFSRSRRQPNRLFLVVRLSLRASVSYTLRPRQDARTTIARHLCDVLGVHGVRTLPARLSASDPDPVPPVPGTSLRARSPLLSAAPLGRPPPLRAVVKAARRVPVLQRPAFKLQQPGLHDAAVCAAAALG